MLSILKRLRPTYLVWPLVHELKALLRHWRYGTATRRAAANKTNLRVNIGCGEYPTPEWFNIDLFASASVHFWDCRRGLPFRDGSVAAIFSEHMLEHLDVDEEARPFLKECFRCLKPGGVLRLIVPDAGAYLVRYTKSWQVLADLRPLKADGDFWHDEWMDTDYRTKMQLINVVFRQGYEHKYAYDEETLILFLREVGFPRIECKKFGQSLDPEMAPDNYGRQSESLYVEAVR